MARMQRLGAAGGSSQGGHQLSAFSSLELRGSRNQPLFPKEELSFLRDYYQDSVQQAGLSWGRGGSKHLGSCTKTARSAHKALTNSVKGTPAR